MSEARYRLFSLGRRVATQNALAVLGEAGMEHEGLFERHAEGDWGVIESKSWYLNRMAVDSGYGCVASAYGVLGKVRVAILTLANHSKALMAPSDE